MERVHHSRELNKSSLVTATQPHTATKRQEKTHMSTRQTSSGAHGDPTQILTPEGIPLTWTIARTFGYSVRLTYHTLTEHGYL